MTHAVAPPVGKHGRDDAGAVASASKQPYRPALDGVRVVAVVLVIAFHAGMRSVPGGFVGVDVFFVLSGFLITRLLLGSARGGGIRFVDFYARRMRRLLPVALLVLVVTGLGWAAVASSVEREPLLDDARSAALYFANWHFAGRSVDYFASGDTPSPFQHYWSLSVEEQFYVAWPAIVAVALQGYRRNPARARRRLAVLAGLLCVVSLALVVLAMRRGDAAYGYFGTHARAYQLLAGGLLAVARDGRAGTAVRRGARAAVSFGQLLALAGILVVASSAGPVNVGLRGMLTAAFAVLLLAALELDPRGALAQPLSWPTVRYLGQLSYGTYLWHWPVILMIERFAVMTPHRLFLVAMVPSFGLAALSYRVLEQPIRRSPALAVRGRRVLAAGLAASAVAGLLVLPPVLASGAEPSVTPVAAADSTGGGAGGTTAATGAGGTGATSASGGSKPLPPPPPTARRTPVPKPDQVKAAGERPPGQTCVQQIVRNGCLARPGKGPKVLVIGDSHLQMFFPVLDQIAARHDLNLYTWMYYVCPWEHDVLPTGTNAEPCRANKALLYDTMLPAIRPDVVITINRGYDDPNYPRPVFSSGAPSSTDPAAVLSAATPGAVDEIRALGARLVVVEPVPSMRTNQRECLARAKFVEQCAGRSAGRLRSERALEQRAATRRDVTVIDLDRAICPRLPVCDAVVGGVITRKDVDHVSVQFARALTGELDRRLAAAGVYRATPN